MADTAINPWSKKGLVSACSEASASHARWVSLDTASVGGVVVRKCHMGFVDGVRLSKGEEGLIEVVSLLYLFRFTMDVLEPGKGPSPYCKVHSSPRLLQWLHFGACRSHCSFVHQHRSLLGQAVSQTFNLNMRNVPLPAAFCNSHVHCGICYDSCGSPFRFHTPRPQCRRRLMQFSDRICGRDKTQCGSWCLIKDYVGPTVCLARSHTI